MTQQRPNRTQRRRSQGTAQAVPRFALPSHAEIDYVKSNYCRVIHADGAFGGPTTQGLVYMALFSEHTKLPPSERFVIDPERLEAHSETSQGNQMAFVREVEVEVLLSLDLAKALRTWLDDKIATIESGKEIIKVREPQS